MLRKFPSPKTSTPMEQTSAEPVEARIKSAVQYQVAEVFEKDDSGSYRRRNSMLN